MQTGCHERWRLRCDSCGGVNKQKDQDQLFCFFSQQQFGATIHVHHCAYWQKYMLLEAGHSEDVQVVRR